MKPCEVVVFDIDDTLYLERDYAASGFAALDPLPDARQALDDLARRGIRVAFLTDGPRDSQAAKVAALDLGCRAWQIIFTADYGTGFDKPHHAEIPHGDDVDSTVENRSGLAALVAADRARQAGPW